MIRIVPVIALLALANAVIAGETAKHVLLIMERIGQ
jgi:hypothetical protein